jgi:primosomal protein N'
MNKGLHDFPEMSLALPPIETLRVNPQLVAELNYDRDVLHRYVDQNLPQFNIFQETAITIVFNAIAQGEGVVFFLDGPSGSGKTFVYSILLASVRRDGYLCIAILLRCSEKQS